MTEMETEIEEIPREWETLILEDQLFDHLATSEGAMEIWREGLNPEILPESEEEVRLLLEFVLNWIDEHREAPDVSVIEKELGFNRFNVPVAPVSYVVGKLREHYKRRHVKRISDEGLSLALDPDEALDYMLSEGRKLHLMTSSKKRVVTSDDLLDVVDRYNLRQTEGLQGISYGLDLIDQHMGGHKKGELNAVAARLKRYKSWLLLNSAVAALETEHNVCFGTLELSEQEMENRFACMVAGISWLKFTTNTLRQEDLIKLEEVGHELREFPFKAHFIRPKPGERTPSHLAAYARDMGADILYIDQLSWLDGARDEKGARHKIGAAMEELKDVAQDMPVYMAVQLNREADAMDGLADISKIAEADFIGQTADNLFAVYASKDMMRQTPRIIHFGLQESRSFEPKAWEVKVDLNNNSAFTCLGELT